MTFRLAKQSKGKVCRESSQFLFNRRPKIMSGGGRRVSFVANSIMFNVNQPSPNRMTLPICLLGQLLCTACLCHSSLTSCGPQQILRSGSLHSGSLHCGSLYSGLLYSESLHSGSLHSGSRYMIHTNYVIHTHYMISTTQRYPV